MDNPFIISGYISPEFFCDREKETEKIISALKNQRNLTLFSIRRMGKTGLIQHVFQKLEAEDSMKCFYLDLMPTNNLNDFINVFANSVLGKMDTVAETWFKKIRNIFSNLNPVITLDNVTGAPSIGLNIRNESEASNSVEKIFEYLKDKQQQIIIAVDEFQQVANYPEKTAEALIRTNVQKVSNINFIFSGSQKHILLSMFGDRNKPLYQSTELFQLKEIDKDIYSDFIISHFEENGKKIDPAIPAKILDWARSHTFYVQYVCNKLYGTNEKTISFSLLNEVLEEILDEKEPMFYAYKNLLTIHQFNLLKAIAKEFIMTNPTSHEFIEKYNLSSLSTVKTALVSLIKKEMVIEEDKTWKVSDVFFSKWLERLR